MRGLGPRSRPGSANPYPRVLLGADVTVLTESVARPFRPCDTCHTRATVAAAARHVAWLTPGWGNLPFPANDATSTAGCGSHLAQCSLWLSGIQMFDRARRA
jgi:hypothetical protein